MRFVDRTEAGRLLARRLEHLRGRDVVVLGLAPGGMPVAREVARHLGAALDVLVVRALGVPWQPELAFGAVGEHGMRVLDDDVIRHVALAAEDQRAVERAERAEVARLTRRYRGERAPEPVAGRTVVVTDEGMADGVTASAACRAVRARGAVHVLLAVPVAPERALARLRPVADQVVCLQPLRHLGSVGAWYRSFPRVEDDTVPGPPARPLREQPGTPAAADAPTAPSGTAHGDARAEAVEKDVPAGPVRLRARLTVPDAAYGLVVLAHGDCVGGATACDCPGHRRVAALLVRAGLGTLLLDLVTRDEARDRHLPFDIVLLARRLRAATRWARDETRLPVAYFGSGTAAAAALEAVALDPGIRAVVGCGGRPDLARPATLAAVHVPTLLAVGARDTRILCLNRLAADWMHCEHRVAVLPGAGSVPEDPAARDEVARLAGEWVTAHLGAARGTPVG
ncbi:phosphoribosyltransferase family protein [Streptomyces galbus]|uniref:Phosphoribosyltransferase n=1 Tax=Streptomyces galbus TaxID=33898 RepID=A0A4U5X588_STRGB|nr:phosphoribosyltransferase family protein [Streptomyces galbus]TKT09702.1 phosphoribosyltransferase [Streptomyces galbus]GHD33069.1 putative phosphoribosyl transferase [Streptomyces galbus]